MAKIAIIFLSLAVIQASWALKCKVCTDDTCSNQKDETCPASPSDREAACLTHIYKDPATKKEYTEKKCVNRLKTNAKYDCIKQKSTEEEIKCVTCTEDFCNANSASKFSFGAVGALSVVLALLAPKLL